MPMTPGMMRAIGKIAANRQPCKDCGFPLPKYPGKYPSKCPNCAADFTVAEKPDDESEEERA